MPRKLDESYAPENGQGFINRKHLCPEYWTELKRFLCPVYWTGNQPLTKLILLDRLMGGQVNDCKGVSGN